LSDQVGNPSGRSFRSFRDPHPPDWAEPVALVAQRIDDASDLAGDMPSTVSCVTPAVIVPWLA
jgi:hypothetical protein